MQCVLSHRLVVPLTRRFHLGFGNGAEADEVFEQAGRGGEAVHGGIMSLKCQGSQCLRCVNKTSTS